jgi:hypothetical protein
MNEVSSLKIARGNVMKLQRLLHMKYKPSEVAEEMGVTVETIRRSYLPAGAPFENDAQGNIWIVGDVFAKWVVDHAKTHRRKAPKMVMERCQAFCVGCNQIVTLLNPKIEKPNARGTAILKGKCPVCGKKANRFCKASEWQG